MLAALIIAVTAVIGGIAYAFRKLNLHHTVFKSVSILNNSIIMKIAAQFSFPLGFSYFELLQIATKLTLFT